MLVANSDQISRLGIEYENVKFLCCTETLVENGVCNNSNSLAFPKDMNPYESNGTFYYFPVGFGNSSLGIPMGSIGPYRINFTMQGIWYLLIVNCNDENNPQSTTIRMIGSSIWVNPYGYLQGQIYGQMPVYWSMMILYSIFLIGWIISVIVNRHDLHPAQHSITLILVLALLENLSYGISFIIYNFNGLNNDIWNGICVFLLSFKLTISRIVLLLVCMGYSVTHMTVTRPQQFSMITLFLAYFIVTSASQFVGLLQDHGGQISYSSTVLLFFLNSVISGTIFIWTFYSIGSMRSTLAEQGDTKKLKLYNYMAISNGTVFAISIIVFIVNFIIDALDLQDKFWLGEFFFTIFWEFAFFFMLVFIAIVWRPNSNNERYSFSESQSFFQLDNEIQNKQSVD